MRSGKPRIPFRYLEPAFLGGLLDDPLLFLRIRPLGRAILFDCGQIAHLAKRVVKPIDAVFISHGHTDHIMGIPTLVRHHHASPRPLDIYGPPGIVERVSHQLASYEWNLPEPTWFTLRVHEIQPERILHYRFPGPEAFARHFDGEEPRLDRQIWSCPYVRVEAEILDHKIPSLAFRIIESPRFTIDPQRLAALGLKPGGWIGALKKRLWHGRTEQHVAVTGQDGAAWGDDPAALYAAIKGDSSGAAIGYLTDIGFTPANIAVIERFLSGLTLLCSECTFLAADVEKARASYHFCTTDLNELAARLAPHYLLPMHLSKSYLRRTVDLYDELQPPPQTVMLRLPSHIVPQPVTVEDVAGWLRPAEQAEGV